jgi:Ca2+-binding EF-hand superfamily protein
MRSIRCLVGMVCLSTAVPALAQAPVRNGMRFQAMDRNRDGVITRDEWNGNDRSFQNQDWNGDGKLSGEEVRVGGRRELARERNDRFDDLDTNRDGRLNRAEWRGGVALFDVLDTDRDGMLTRVEAVGTQPGRRRANESDEFTDIDVNRDGRITRDEWQWNAAAFDRLDANRDGRLVRGEFETTPPPSAATETATYRAGYERGRSEGIQAGKEDKPRGWDLEGQRELETADSGYEGRLGPLNEYQAGYRAGFRRGYREGFGIPNP